MLTQEMAENSSLRSVITRAIGMAETVQPDFFAANFRRKICCCWPRTALPVI